MPFDVSRRTLLQGIAPAALLLGGVPASASVTQKAQPFPLEAVRLLPSPWLDAVEANRAYLHRLDPDRLLHNFREQAGLAVKGQVYGGWEADTIAGHSLGHYMTALALMVAQTGDEHCRKKLAYIVAELALCQGSDGYVAGFTRKRDDRVEPGRLVFDEVKRGDIRVRPFDLNGCWVPLYNWHKLLIGLLAADHCGIPDAIKVAEHLGMYIDGVFAALNDDQVQTMLDCEHGGLNEAFAELYARTADRRWLALAERIYHRRILAPLSRQEDDLAYIHANTQIPKVIGLSRLYELTGSDHYRKTANFFWERVTQDYSYVIGGNSDVEYFTAPGKIAENITDQTCESCNSYNMLKLTRHLYAQSPQASYFDYYERTHLNHILAQQNPHTGMFAYMVPLMAGTHRQYSTPFDDFWCCVGSGMESHAKHGDSIYWRSGRTLMVNLYIPSTLNWPETGLQLRLDTRYPFADDVALTITKARGKNSDIMLRVPGWCERAAVAVNGETVASEPHHGYLTLSRAWRAGDVIQLTLPRNLRVEATPDDPDTFALLMGPLVLAADLGPATDAWTGPAPVLLGSNPLEGITVGTEPATFHTGASSRPENLTLRPFTFQHERNSAVYFRQLSPSQYVNETKAFEADQARLRSLQEASVDIVHLGSIEAERDHQLDAKLSYPLVYRGREGRDARTGGFFEFTAKSGAGPLILQASYWGQERNRRFSILVDGEKIADETLSGDGPVAFIERRYAIPEELSRGKQSLRIRFEPETGYSAGPAFGVWLYPA